MSQLFSINSVLGFTFEEAARIYRTHFDSKEAFAASRPELAASDWGKSFMAHWNVTNPLTIKDREQFSDTRGRLRTFFWALRPVRFFRSLNPIVEDTVECDVERTIWDRYGNPRKVQSTRRYELLSVAGDQIGASDGRVYGLEMTCPTTGAAYLVLVSKWSNWTAEPARVADALKFMYSNKQPHLRHGDVLIGEPLTREQYDNLNSWEDPRTSINSPCSAVAVIEAIAAES